MPIHPGKRYEKKHVRLHEGDWERLQELYPEHGPTVIIRSLVRATIKKVDEQVNAQASAPLPDVQLPDLRRTE
jgi:hypothetical protein